MFSVVEVSLDSYKNILNKHNYYRLTIQIFLKCNICTYIYCIIIVSYIY